MLLFLGAYELYWPFCFMKLNTIFVIANILSRSDKASFSSVIICCTTVKIVYMSKFSLLTRGAGND
jgi:uncharacterized secreted protein with C-terminal beta-propeller domain